MRHADAWAIVGKENLSVAQQLFEHEKWRSCVSRAYYSAMATTHAILILHCRAMPPERGNWSNQSLPVILFDQLKGMHGRSAKWHTAVKMHRNDLNNCWTNRLLADYRPLSHVTGEAAWESLKVARRLRKLMEKLT